jgi:transcriptional regulator with XRE-family HTH domain
MSPRPASARAAADPALVLSHATVRAARFLAVAQADLAAIIGVSAATLSRLANGQRLLQPGSKPWQLAALFVRLFRSLDAIVGGDETVARAWLANPNLALGGKPAEKMRTVAGLTDVIAYLDARKSVV